MTDDTLVLRAVIALGAYFLGSVPFGLIVTRLGGAGDIRAIGSGNIGATNVLRTGRKGLAATTLLLDGLKGFVAVIVARLLPRFWFDGGGGVVDPSALGTLTTIAAAIAAAAVVVGHCFPVWLKFHGGKGVATALGVAFALDWRIGLLCAIAWLLTARLTRMSSAGALAAIALLPPALWFLDGSWPAVAGLVVAIIVFGRHHENIARLRAGTEPRIGASSKSA